MAVTNFDVVTDGDLRKMLPMHQLFPLFLTEKEKKENKSYNPSYTGFLETKLNGVCAARCAKKKGREKNILL